MGPLELGHQPDASAIMPEEWLAGRTWRDLEAAAITWSLHRHGSIRRAAEALGRAPSTLADRIKHLGIAWPPTRRA